MTQVELIRLFFRERAKFEKLYPELESVGLEISFAECSPGSPCRKRDLAWYDPKARRVGMLSKALRRPRRTIVALLRHELGHAADRFSDRSGAEARADAIALEATGAPIRYDAAGLQTTGPGKPRPRWLHQ